MEAHILNIYFTLYILQCLRSLCNFWFLLQQIKDSACTGKSILKFCNNRTDVIEWLHILIGIGEKYGKTSDCQSASRDNERTHQCNTGINNIIDKTGGRVCQAAVKDSLQAAFL